MSPAEIEKAVNQDIFETKFSRRKKYSREFNLDQKTKQAFGKFIKAARKKKEATGEHSQIIICGSEDQNYTPQDIKHAYQIVQADLFNAIVKAPEGSSLRLGNLGKFTKKEQRLKSALFKTKSGNQSTFVYYRINFKPFSKLKTALSEQIIKQYRLK
ncbi:6803_t:CDS:2 [Funneliformis geosporum]|uniref:6803_t:CDS:1 n=1 Tax=Funneliformis geosporum TaxID=1117311 RepID=A0A9W4WHR5_9GLOM|nr:6803_t:CDS:2 [Funneliformis geosporum]